GPWVQLALRLPPEASAPGLYRTDLRAPRSSGHVWEIELRSSTAGEAATLELTAGARLPDSLCLRPIDRELGTARDLRRGAGSLASYRLLSTGPRRAYRLTLLAGSEAFVSHSPAAELAIPRQVLLDPAVPNPSGAAMRIRFGLPAAQAATLEVLDVLGRRVSVLLDNAWQGAGYHALLWDGVARGGARVSAGVYFLRRSTRAGQLTRRIVRLE